MSSRTVGLSVHTPDGQRAGALSGAPARSQGRAIDLFLARRGAGLDRRNHAAARLVHPEDVKRQFVILAGQADRLCRAVGTDARKADLAPDWCALTDIARGLHGLEKPVDISEVMSAVDRLLDESVAAKALIWNDPASSIIGLPVFSFSLWPPWRLR